MKNFLKFIKLLLKSIKEYRSGIIRFLKKEWKYLLFNIITILLGIHVILSIKKIDFTNYEIFETVLLFLGCSVIFMSIMLFDARYILKIFKK